MKYVTREDDISVLQMSVRVTNCMNRVKLHTVGEFLDYPEDQFLDIRNLGKTSLEEIMRIRTELTGDSGTQFRLVDKEDLPENDSQADDIIVPGSAEEDSPVLLYNLPISEMGLSVRARNCLNREGWTTASQLVGKSLEDLLSVKNMGRKTAEEILATVSELSLRLSDQATGMAASGNNEIAALAEELASVFGGMTGTWALKLEQLREGNAYDRETLLNRLLQESEIRSAQKNAICDYLEAHEDQASMAELMDYMEMRLANGAFTVSLIEELENEERIERNGSMVLRRYPSAVDYAAGLKDERQKEVLLSRLSGKTLEETASVYDITRERARQIQKKALTGRPRLREDRYMYVFQTYYFSPEDFRLAFDEPDEVFSYLEIISGRKQTDTLPLEKALEDESISVKMRRQIERAVYKQFVIINGVRILKKRPELVRYVVSRFCREQTDYQDFLSYYEMFLEDHGLAEKEDLIIDSRTYENKLNACDYVLWAHGKRLRYYPIADHDSSELFSIITSEEYQNKELSARLFFLNYPELMRELDICDEYELHNLLRKAWPEEDDRVHFGKNPTLTIGQANRDDQVLNLLLQFAPISAQELAAKMEELYGFDQATSIGSYFNSFRDYYHNGVYSISAAALPQDRFSAMQTLLTGDYYSIAEIQKQYLKRFPSAQRTDINPYTLNTLGFHVYSGYVVSRRFANATDYFSHLLTGNDITDLNGINREIQNIGAFSSTLAHLRQRRELVEFEPHQLIHIRRLETGGITREKLEDYCNSVYSRLGHNRVFTIHSLRSSGFAHELDDFGFDDWFYSSLLCEDPRFSSRRIGGTRLLYSGQRAITLEDLLLDLLLEREKLEIYELKDLLEDEYGICLEKDKLVWLIKESSLYYDNIMETVYIDYDTYFEEI